MQLRYVFTELGHGLADQVVVPGPDGGRDRLLERRHIGVDQGLAALGADHDVQPRDRALVHDGAVVNLGPAEHPAQDLLHRDPDLGVVPVP